MNKLLSKIKNYFYQPIEVDGTEMLEGVKKTIEPKEKASFAQNSMTYGDRKRYFNNYNQDLVNRISEIKSANS
jgi:hypothetical protein